MFKSIEFFKGKSRGEEYGLLRRNTPRNDVCSVGRSMIEMLGVLAIVGVLTVGGIAGYSKAMEKFKVNKLIAEYGEILQGLVEYKEHFMRVNPDKQTGLAEVLQAANIVPENWQKHNDIWFSDAQGNSVAFYSMKFDYGKGVAMDIYLGGRVTGDDGKTTTADFSEKLCLDLFNNVIYPLHSALYKANVSYNEGGWKITDFWGDGYCREGEKCLASSTLADFHKACQICNTKDRECDIGIKLR